jgi:hypothetical protein
MRAFEKAVQNFDIKKSLHIEVIFLIFI